MNQSSGISQASLVPSNILVEEIIIGQLLSDTSTRQYILLNTASNFFSLQKHRILYNCLTEPNSRHSLTEAINKLWNQELLSAIGGLSSIIRIVHKSQTLSPHQNPHVYTQHLIEILHNNYIKRLFIQYGHSILQLSHFHRLSIKEIYGKAGKYLSNIHKNADSKSEMGLRRNIGDMLYKLGTSSKTDNKVLSGFRDLDKITNGFTAGELIVMAGRPSMGKTSMVINIAHYGIFILKLQVQIFSLEMSKNEILDKIISLASNVSIQKIQQKTIGRHEWSKIQDACGFLMSSPLWINDHGSSSIEQIKQHCRNNLAKKTLVIIDYLQLIKTDIKFDENRSQEISVITRELKLLAKSINSPIILLSQLNRNIENRVNKRPLLSDLRESGCVSFLNKPSLSTSNNQSLNIRLIYCIKEFYTIEHKSQLNVKIGKKQYIYALITQAKELLYITHNHKILIYKTWLKKDQVKQETLQNLSLNKGLNGKLVMEAKHIRQIKLLNKEKVYDVTLHNYPNFLVHNSIVHNSIEQDADLILMLYKNIDEDVDNTIDIVVAKHRNGPIGSFRLLFYAETCKFSNINTSSLLDIC